MRKLTFVTWITAGVLLAGCASAGGGGGGDAMDTSWSKNLGRISYASFMDGYDQIIIRKYNFAIYRREEQYNTVYLETEWKIREPLPDEMEQGVTGARTRFIVNARRSDGPVFRITIEAENQVRSQMDPQWREEPLTPGFEDYVRGIVMDLEAEVRTGIR